MHFTRLPSQKCSANAHSEQRVRKPASPAHPTPGLILLFSSSLASLSGFSQSIALLFAFASLCSSAALSTCHVFSGHLWFVFVSSFVQRPIRAPVFSFMIYKSSKCTCSPDAGPSCARHPLWLLCRCASEGPVSMATEAWVSTLP